jgi:hypothetical protein
MLSHSVWLVVNLRQAYSSSRIGEALHLNGRSITWVRAEWSSVPNALSFEAEAEITPAVDHGANLITFEVMGTSGLFDLDIYDLRLRSQSKRRE